MNKYIFIVLYFLSCNCVFSQNLVPILKVAKKPNYSSLTENIKQTNIIPQLQESLQKYIKNHANPIAAVVVVEVASGKILALSSSAKKIANDKNKVYDALYPGYPSASIFKLVSTIAAVEDFDMNVNDFQRKVSSCRLNKKNPPWKSYWRHNRAMTLSKAYGQSCNGFYAFMGISILGVSNLRNWASKLGWGHPIQADFSIPISKIDILLSSQASSYSMGKQFAGFGNIGLSPVHAAWLTLLIANKGISKDLRLFKNNNNRRYIPIPGKKIFSTHTASELQKAMSATVRYGTAASVFRKRRYRSLRKQVGGKTGTLTGKNPKGLTTWFVGMMPYNNPQVVVSAVVVNNNSKWVIKGTHLAAEALRVWKKL
jgi:cell division protein FtsI/penicillin-binding protein 2